MMVLCAKSQGPMFELVFTALGQQQSCATRQHPGDELVCLGYSGSQISGIIDEPEESYLYRFRFACFMPCIEEPEVNCGGQIYHTTQILSQCWLRENLNIGVMINTPALMEDNGIIEKYCYNNDPDSCLKYGGLYNLHEALQYMYRHGA